MPKRIPVPEGRRARLACILAAGMMLAGCGSSQGIKTFSYPAAVDGIPVHRVAWDRPLPYVSKPLYIPWRTKAPKSYAVSPKSAIIKALGTWPHLRTDAKAIYIQPTGLVGGRTGNPASAYVVEFIGPNLGLNGAPTFTKPKLQFVLSIVYGRSGKADMAVGGGYPAVK